jgi:hypothetical protein
MVDIMYDKDQLDATKYADLLTQHVSGTNMHNSTAVSSTLVSKPGKPPGLCSAGLLDVCTAWRMWPVGSHPPSSTHI